MPTEKKWQIEVMLRDLDLDSRRFGDGSGKVV